MFAVLVASLLVPHTVAEKPLPSKAPGPGFPSTVPNTPNVECSSTKGSFTIEMHPEWSPLGAQRFLDVVADGGYDGTVIYRVVKNGPKTEAVQFGYIKDKRIKKKWDDAPNLPDEKQIFHDPNFHKGMISFAGGGPNTRGVDLFITFLTGNANGTPRAPWETPFGIINEEGLKTVAKFGGVGDLGFLGGDAPQLEKGYEALKVSHPNIDYLDVCKLVYPTDTNAGAATETKKAAIHQAEQHSTQHSTQTLPEHVDSSKGEQPFHPPDAHLLEEVTAPNSAALFILSTNQQVGLVAAVAFVLLAFWRVRRRSGKRFKK